MLRRIHSLPGLVLGLLLALIAGSGAVLSVQPAIERAAAPPQSLTIAETAAAITAARPAPRRSPAAPTAS